jgi:hypothetical protein
MAGPRAAGVVSSDMAITTMKGALRATFVMGTLMAVAIGGIGISSKTTSGVELWSKACGGDKALHADPTAFSRCMRAVPASAD